MIIPIRCISCGRLIADKWDDYEKQVKAGKNAKDILDNLGVESYCCRSIFLTHIDLIGKISRYKNRTVPRTTEHTEEDAPAKEHHEETEKASE